MEWIIGFFILWLIGVISDGSSSSNSSNYGRKLSNRKKTNTNKSLDEILKELGLPNDSSDRSTNGTKNNIKFNQLNEYSDETTEVKINPTNSYNVENLSIALTPEKYLSEIEKNERKKVLSSSKIIFLDIFHEKNNSHDKKALKIFHDKIFIGYIIKYNTNGAVDKFCFDEDLFKNDIRLKWDGGSFLLFVNKCSQIIKLFNEYGVYSLWHMTHRNNVVNIMQHGILSNTQTTKSAKPVDISDHGVQRWREEKDPIYGRKIHDYTPTYFNIRNPMLYVRKNIQDELCLIEISLSVLSEANFLFTDGNAAARDTAFYNSLDDLAHLPWKVLNASYWNDFEYGKRKRCAEVLIYPSIDPKYIKQIHCNSDVTLQQLSRINCNVTKTRELFF